MQTHAEPSSHIDQVLDRNGYYVLAGSHDERVRHWHRGVEMVLVHTGTVEVFAQKWCHILRPGEVSFYSAQNVHGASGMFNRTVIHFVPDLLPTGAGDKLNLILETERSCRISPHPESVSRLIWAAQELIRLPAQSRTLPTAQALVGLVLAEIEVALNSPWKPANADLLQDVIEYMRANVASEETLDVLADRFRVSRGHLHRLFMAQLGCSPRQYWLALKLEKACALLHCNESVQSVSGKVGFLSARGFEQAFQRAYNMSPSEYRSRTGNPSANAG